MTHLSSGYVLHALTNTTVSNYSILTQRCRLWWSRSGRTRSVMWLGIRWISLSGMPASSCESTHGRHIKDLARLTSPTPDIRLKPRQNQRLYRPQVYIISGQNYDMPARTSAPRVYRRFLPRDAIHKRGLYSRTVSVNPSVCHFRVFYQNE